MSEAKFTKNKWVVADGTLVGEQILFVHCPDIRGVVCRLTRAANKDKPLSEEDIANAHLIAAAPEMYEAMQEFVNRVDRGEVRSTATYNKFKTILAKARGEL